ncbi:hypothetical protein BJ878DRAFT_31602 [Calycina marina]|uniref:DUF7704 domain-containing protein n=1 Tax=Calycina marina TaxID=1763456 RepID=A0A9P7Z5D5_9HELO|nr:hypothetical protein BJ878DRAFT_31602 [Calycina marina]
MPNFILPPLYTWFFLFVEPISALVGAYFAHFKQEDYLQMTHAASATGAISQSTSIVLSQLANLYLLFAINEALVLRSTPDLRVWKTVLIGLLIADFGHLYSVKSLGLGLYLQPWSWNAMHWGNIGFVYAGASRIAFLSGLGINSKRSQETAAAKLKSK